MYTLSPSLTYMLYCLSLPLPYFELYYPAAHDPNGLRQLPVFSRPLWLGKYLTVISGQRPCFYFILFYLYCYCGHKQRVCVIGFNYPATCDLNGSWQQLGFLHVQFLSLLGYFPQNHAGPAVIVPLPLPPVLPVVPQRKEGRRE